MYLQELPQNTTVIQSEHTEQYSKVPMTAYDIQGQSMISAVDNNIIWGMPGTTSGAYCQQWTTITGATCICDAIFKVEVVPSEHTEQYSKVPMAVPSIRK